MFLLKNDRPEVVTSYIEYSMRHEKRLRDRIRSNIAARGGDAMHIEERMLRSIEASAEKSGINLDSIAPPKNWGGKNLFEKAREVELEDAYLGAFAGPSHSVHGNWQDLLEYHLEVDDDGYRADLEWHRPRPQLLSTLAHLTMKTPTLFFSHAVGEAGDEMTKKFPDLEDRLRAFVYLHEAFLARI